jgi:hypothetical protein
VTTAASILLNRKHLERNTIEMDKENVPFTVSIHASSHPELDTQEIRH